MSISIKRSLKAVPGVVRLYKLFLRLFRKWYWRTNFRHDDLKTFVSPNYPAQLFCARMKEILSEQSATVLEIGCGNGRELLELARAFKQSKFIGVDIQEEAIDFGRLRAREQSVENIELSTGDAVDFLRSSAVRVDTFCVCACLIYFSEREVRELFALLLAKRVGRLVFCEITSRVDRTIKEHIYIHNYRRILGEILRDAVYSHSEEFFAYPPWEGVVHQGAIHIVSIEQPAC